jgi:hypothetical protein
VLIFYVLIDKEGMIEVTRLEKAMSNHGNVARGSGEFSFNETVMAGGLIVRNVQ